MIEEKDILKENILEGYMQEPTVNFTENVMHKIEVEMNKEFLVPSLISKKQWRVILMVALSIPLAILCMDIYNFELDSNIIKEKLSSLFIQFKATFYSGFTVAFILAILFLTDLIYRRYNSSKFF